MGVSSVWRLLHCAYLQLRGAAEQHFSVREHEQVGLRVIVSMFLINIVSAFVMG